MERKTEKVRRFYTALAQGDFETVGALLCNDLIWHQPGEGALSGVYNGKQNVFAHLGRMAQLSNGTFAIDQVDYVIHGVGKRTFDRNERRGSLSL